MGEQSYLNLCQEVLEKGHYRPTRNGHTYSLFGKHLEFDLRNSFPLLTTKKMFFRGIFEELNFFLSGSTNSKILEEKGVNIWKANTSKEFIASQNLNYEEGDIGALYFYQIYHFNAPYEGCLANYEGKGFNQFEQVIHLLKTDRFSRRILMTTYNPLQAEEGVLYPCHGITIQFAVEGTNELCCHMYQRSADIFLGLPFNIASYSLLTIILCNILNNEVEDKFVPGKLCISLGDCHIYEQHIEAVRTQLSREPLPFPQLEIINMTTLENITIDNCHLTNYVYHPAIKADMIA